MTSTVLLLALAFAAPAMAGDLSDPTANYAGVGTLGAPVEADGRPKGAGVSTPWGVLDLSLGRTEMWNDELPDAIRRSGLSPRLPAIDRAIDTGLDALGFSLKLSIKY